jgi:hypothetical protein
MAKDQATTCNCKWRIALGMIPLLDLILKHLLT